jgi:uncharacterized Zn-binding protein involved in type VI secretion
MPAVARAESTDTVSVHECGVIPNCDTGSPDVYVNGKKVHREGDNNTAHPYLPPPAGCPTHATALSSGSPNVYVNGHQIGRLGDPYSCGITITSGSENVFAN